MVLCYSAFTCISLSRLLVYLICRVTETVFLYTQEQNLTKRSLSNQKEKKNLLSCEPNITIHGEKMAARAFLSLQYLFLTFKWQIFDDPLQKTCFWSPVLIYLLSWLLCIALRLPRHLTNINGQFIRTWIMIQFGVSWTSAG